ncbi:hypothetical protein [Aureliella helgolandensis]|uniref:Uncharacterized protein n=1 Tax=Aureliella helgolandensis TaxID=2527968 RepID=A0A518G169_9BACT|nr:hypothetical protein [Aureliella helgolandensis]QDV22343.1 hypothetical protein Q31a_06270 [Aureliella helgolandensis]
MLEREEYIEQAYFFRVLVERLGQSLPLQDLLEQTKFELLATTHLPMAIDLLLGELKHHGLMSTGMLLLKHYFAPFQTFLIAEAETDSGRFDYRTALKILSAEANYRAQESISPEGLFFYQFEALSRNRLNYDRGLKAMADDTFYPPDWQAWLLILRRQLGLVELSDMIYGRSQLYFEARSRLGITEPEAPILFGLGEGRIAQANRHKDPLFLFAAMQRQLGYPAVPRLEPIDPIPSLIPRLQRRIEQMETRIRLLEQEQRGGIDITKFYGGKIPLPSEELPE